MNDQAIPAIPEASKSGGVLVRLKKSRTLLLMATPAIIFFLVFNYLPLPGLYLAFIRFNYNLGIFKSPFVGWENFKFLWLSGNLFSLTRNTILYNLAFILSGNIFQIAAAVMLNEIGSYGYRKITQTLLLLPHFISFVIIGVFAYNILNYEYGALNALLKSVGLVPVSVYNTPNVWPYIIVGTNLWKGLGYGTIVYFAAITSINPEIYEAAYMDGVNAFQRVRYITLPNLRPTFIILLLFALGQVMRGNFQLFYNMVGSNALLYPKTDIIETFVFRALMVNFNFSMGAAVSLYQSIFGFALVMFSNWMVRRIEPDYALF